MTRAHYRGIVFRALSLVALMALAALTVGATADEAKLAQIYGQVQVQRSGSTSWIPANARMRVRVGDHISTGANAWCLIELSDANYVRLMVETEVVIETLAAVATRTATSTSIFLAKTEGYVIRLVKGRVFPSLGRLRQRSFEIATPVATVGVRGTVFMTDLQSTTDAATGSTSYDVDVACYEGQVAVTDLTQPSAGPTFIPAGYGIQIRNVVVGADGRPQQGGGPEGGNRGQPGGGPGGPGQKMGGGPEGGEKSEGGGPGGEGGSQAGQQSGQPMQQGGQQKMQGAGSAPQGTAGPGMTSTNQGGPGGHATPSGPLASSVVPLSITPVGGPTGGQTGVQNPQGGMQKDPGAGTVMYVAPPPTTGSAPPPSGGGTSQPPPP